MKGIFSFFRKDSQTQAAKPTSSGGKKEPENEQVGTPWGYLLVFAVFGVTVVALYNIHDDFRHTAFTLTLAVCATVIGIFLGFLFGVPRTVQDDQAAKATGTAGTPSQTSGVSYRANTNLEQISDWLTKILVGVGLTQLTKIPGKLLTFGDFLKVGMGGTDAARSFGILVFLFFVTFGFLVGFLWTRLYLGREFRLADIGVLARQIEEIKSQPDKDARALSLAAKMLAPAADAPPPSEEELKQAIKEASAPTRLLVFEQARNARKLASPGQAQQLDRIASVLRALIDADDAKQFHRNFGQLGYVLKEKTPPDWQGAMDALTQAIQIRDRLNVNGYQLYELNRASCRVQLFPQPTEEQKQQTAADIKAALKVDPDFIKDKAIQSWMTQNNVQL